MLLINNFSWFSRQDIYVWSVPAYPIAPTGDIQPEKKDGADGPVLYAHWAGNPNFHPSMAVVCKGLAVRADFSRSSLPYYAVPQWAFE